MPPPINLKETPLIPPRSIQTRIFDNSVIDQRSNEEIDNHPTLQGPLTHNDAHEVDESAKNWSYDSDGSDKNQFLELELPIFQRGVSIQFDRELPDPADSTIDYSMAINEYINGVKNEIEGDNIRLKSHGPHARVLDEPDHPLQEPASFWTTCSPSCHEIGLPPWNNREYQECLALIDNPEGFDLLLGTPLFAQRFVNYLRNHHDEASLSLVHGLELEFTGQNSPLAWNDRNGWLHRDWIHVFGQHLELVRFAPPVVRSAFWIHQQESARDWASEPILSDSVNSEHEDKENWEPEGPEELSQGGTDQLMKTRPSANVNVHGKSTQYLHKRLNERKPTVSYGTSQTVSPNQTSAVLAVPRGRRSLTRDDVNSEEADEITNHSASDSQIQDESDFEPEIVANVNGKRHNGARFDGPKKGRTVAGPDSHPKTRGGNNHMYNKWPQCRIDMFISANRGKPLPAAAQGGKNHLLDSVCTPEVVDIRFLGQHAITAVELATFFPKHTAWRSIMNRFVKNGWESGNLVKFILYTRGIQNTEVITASALSHAKAKAIEWATAKSMPTGQVTDWAVGNISADRDARGINRDLIDYRIADLAGGVQVMPSGEDRQILTAAVELARRTNSKTLLSQFPQYVRKNWTELHMAPGIVSLSRNAGNVDVDGLSRVMDVSNIWAQQIGYKRR